MRRVFVRPVGMLRRRTVNVRIASRLTLQSSRSCVVRRRPDFLCLARIVRGRGIRPVPTVIAVHCVLGTIVAASVPVRRSCIAWAIVSTSIGAIRAMVVTMVG